MTQIISLVSCRGGTGKTHLAANLGYELFRLGRRVGLVDTDMQSPGLHILFEVNAAAGSTLNDFLWGRCGIEQASRNLGQAIAQDTDGCLHLLPASPKAVDIAREVKEGYDVELMNDGLTELCRALELDTLIIDTPPGLTNEALLSLAICSEAFVVMQPDQQDYQGSTVLIEVARRLDAPRLSIIVNKVHSAFQDGAFRDRVSHRFGIEVAAILGISEELIRMGSSGLICRTYPEAEFSHILHALAARISAPPSEALAVGK